MAGYLTSVQLDWPLILGVTAAAIAGSFVRGRLAGKVREVALRKAFGGFVLVMGGFVLLQQGPSWALPLVAAGAAALGVAVALCLSFVRSCPLRRIITA